jgi:hypothetical protein
MIKVTAELDESTIEGMTRYRFELFGKSGESSRTLIVDIPDDDEGTCDVWVADSSVAVGDTPDDGFATFTPDNK